MIYFFFALGFIVGGVITFIILSTVLERWHRKWVEYRIMLTKPYAHYRGVNVQEDGIRCKLIDERE